MHNPTPASDSWKKTPGKKNKVRWCRGKEGREHTPEIRVAYWYSRFERRCGRVADLYPWWADAPFYRKLGPDTWICGHEKYCSTCGKVFGAIDPKNCPKRDRPAVD